jgi:hypothetical protein
MTTMEKVQKAQEILNENFSFTSVEVSNWKNERIYINRPDQSKAYQAVGYVRISDGKTFPAFGTKARTERDRDAQKMLDFVADVLTSA